MMGRTDHRLIFVRRHLRALPRVKTPRCGYNIVMRLLLAVLLLMSACAPTVVSLSARVVTAPTSDWQQVIPGQTLRSGAKMDLLLRSSRPVLAYLTQVRGLDPVLLLAEQMPIQVLPGRAAHIPARGLLKLDQHPGVEDLRVVASQRPLSLAQVLAAAGMVESTVLDPIAPGESVRGGKPSPPKDPRPSDADSGDKKKRPAPPPSVPEKERPLGGTARALDRRGIAVLRLVVVHQ